MARADTVAEGGAEVVEIQDNDVAARCSDSAGPGKPAISVVKWRRRSRVINVEVMIGGEIRIERDCEKAAFAGGIDGKADEWCAEQHTVFDHAQLPTLLTDKKPSIWGERHRRW